MDRAEPGGPGLESYTWKFPLFSVPAKEMAGMHGFCAWRVTFFGKFFEDIIFACCYSYDGFQPLHPYEDGSTVAGGTAALQCATTPGASRWR